MRISDLSSDVCSSDLHRPVSPPVPGPRRDMTHFTYVDGRLCAEGVALERIAAEIGTPFYCYSSATLIERYKAYEKAFARHRARICYAMKAIGRASCRDRVWQSG